MANRDNCRLLLIRLKMDGWALGKTKVFLKYYHVEFLSKLYEEHVKKIVLIQACIRRWLAKTNYKKQKWQLACSVVTLQRHIRGWLSRRRTNPKLLSRKLSNFPSPLDDIPALQGFHIITLIQPLFFYLLNHKFSEFTIYILAVAAKEKMSDIIRNRKLSQVALAKQMSKLAEERALAKGNIKNKDDAAVIIQSCQ